MQFDEGELGGSVDRHEEVELALFGPDLGDVDVEEADRVVLEPGALRLVAVGIGQAGDAMTLKAAMQRRSRQMRDCRLKRVETVVERQQRMAAEGDDDGFLLDRQHRRSRLFRSGARSATEPRFFHLATVFGLIP